MRALLTVPAVIVLGLAVSAISVFGFGDKQTLVPPPEAVAEGFLRILAANRPESARALLCQETKRRMSRKDLRSFGDRLEGKLGGITDVRGESATIHGNNSTATILVKTDRQLERRLQLKLRRENGLWRIDQLPQI